MIVFDQIVSSLQRTGGISILFEKIAEGLQHREVPFQRFFYGPHEGPRFSCDRLIKPRVGERYRPFDSSSFEAQVKVFHSTYYRIPSDGATPVVTTVHDFTYERVVGGLKSAVHSFQKRRSILGSDHIICVSHHTKNDLLHFIPEAERIPISVVYNGVAGVFSEPSTSQPTGERYVLFVGQRGRYKNFSLAVEALSKFPDLQLVCAGGGPFQKCELGELERHLPKRYRHLGYVSETELVRAYQDAYCLIYPSSYEGFGIPLVEAMRTGCPIIAQNVSSIPEVAGDAAILFEEASTAAIVDALERLPGCREQLVRRGYERARGFSWNTTVTETLDIYKRFL